MTGHGFDSEAVKAALTDARFLDLVETLGGSFKGARRGGRDVRIPCFMHGGSGPNLVLTPNRDGLAVWHCMSQCGGGDVFALVERARGVPFSEALAWVGEWAGFRPNPQPRFPNPVFQKPRLDSKGQGPGVDGEAPRTRGDARERPRSNAPTPTTSTRPDSNSCAFLAALWSCVVSGSWSGPVARWLVEARGVEPDAAFALGCRDFGTARHDLAALVDATPLDVLEAVGLARAGRLHPALDGSLRGDPAWCAVAVPVWRLGAACPTRWRFRLLEPRRVRDGAKVKVFGPYGGGSDLLGFGRPARLEAPEVELAWLGSGTEGSELVLLVEGEPDWWSTTEVVDGRAVVLGVCGAPGRWRAEWPELGDLAALGVRRVAVCVHRGAPGSDGLGHGERFARAVEGACARAGVTYTKKLPAEGRDLNDLHRAGALRGWLADVLEVNHGA